VSDLARALVDELVDDPIALARLRELVAAPVAEPATTAAAYTTATLAAELGRTPRSIRDAIRRGELQAVKRGQGYVISADAVASWAQAAQTNRRVVSSTQRRRGAGAGPMRRALERGAS
jgi:excisionase family DNA binding protein